MPNVGDPSLVWLGKRWKIHKVYIHSHSVLLLLFTNIFIHIQQPNLHSRNIFIHIYRCISYSRLYLLTFTRCFHPHSTCYSFTFTIEIFIQHFLHTTFAHHYVPAPALQFLKVTRRTEGDQRPMIPNTSVTWAKLELWS